MCYEHKIAESEIFRFIGNNSGKVFNVQEVIDSVKEKGGFLEVAPNESIEDFLENLSNLGVISKIERNEYKREKISI
jgi:hypothetical protein